MTSNDPIPEIYTNDLLYSVDDIKRRLASVFPSSNVRKAILFGSYAKGSATPQSDVDIVVDSDLKGFDFFGLIEDIYQALEKNVDIIPLASVEKNSRIDSEIQRTGVTIYG